MSNDGKNGSYTCKPLYALVDAVSRGVYPSQTAGVITSLGHDLDESKITENDMKIIELQDKMRKFKKVSGFFF